MQIGRADVVRNRPKAHSRLETGGGKDSWTDVLIVTSKDTNLTKARARYLESRPIAVAAGRILVLNKTIPGPVALPEADVSATEHFIAEVQNVFPVLGVNLLRGKSAVSPITANEAGGSDSPVFEVGIPKGGQTRAQDIDGKFTVLADSHARLRWATGKLKTPTHTHRDLCESLIAREVLAQRGELMVFTRNQVFSSPTAAAVTARTETRNGRHSWRVEGSQVSDGEWREHRIGTTAAAPT
ncbi:MAG: GIY-YIG nuclease family protein [Bifidobacteriaceae bacterium]|jgi:hypothetical protein|nr:GIY-YIG nuclease family protein [Bifidobacteriaceae bacterium]